MPRSLIPVRRAAVLAALLGAAAAPQRTLPESALLAAIPAGAIEVAPAVVSATAGAPIVMHGRLVAASDTFEDGRAAFLLVDDAAAAALRADADAAGKPCPIPATQRAVVQIVNDQGQVLGTSVRGRDGLVPGAEVFVVGTVASANRGDSLVVNATRLHVPKGSLPPGAVAAAEGADAARVKAAGRDVAAVKGAKPKKGDSVTLSGRVGGSAEPFVSGRAMLTLVGSGIKACSDIPGDACKKPWDYCCEPAAAIRAHSATIQFVDAKGMPLRTDLKGRAGMKELSDLVVEGTVTVVEGDVLVVNATRVTVVPK